MALSDMFEADETCPKCDKNLNDLANGKEVCNPCADSGEARLAQYTVLQHLWAAVFCLFHFHFSSMFMEVLWTIERLFKIGDYHPTKGRFYKLGYLTDQ